MKRQNCSMPDPYSSLLSVFNIMGGELNIPKSNGLEDDLQKLAKDQRVLEEDYKRATQRLMKDFSK